jgi:glycerophosphoryl diester phosphodiesterase
MRSSPFAAFDRRLTRTPDSARVGFLLNQDVAHRGLWGPGVPENSLAAASAAIAQGFAIECDVRLSRDGTVIVFHDADTQRMTGLPGAIGRMAVQDATALLLGGGPERVPSLAQFLARIAGRVPLLIEIKTDTRAETSPLCLAVRRALEGYRGPVAVMGFSPEVGHWFAAHAPKIVRGLVMTEHRETNGRAFRDAILRRLAVLRAKPDFVAYDVHHLPSSLPTALRSAGVPVLSWTVRSEEDATVVGTHADRPIFERREAA